MSLDIIALFEKGQQIDDNIVHEDENQNRNVKIIENGGSELEKLLNSSNNSSVKEKENFSDKNKQILFNLNNKSRFSKVRIELESENFKSTPIVELSDRTHTRKIKVPTSTCFVIYRKI
jgi:hypothetical protein